jgi:heat-inducible transcriptional repressor
MLSKRALNRRTEEVLETIVKAYIETGEPVASRAVSTHTRDSLSSATIRNVMVDLGEEGYLSQPHTSAGRIPTAKALQHYARCLTVSRVSGEDVAKLREQLSESPTVEGRVERSSHLLSLMTNSVGIAAAAPGSGPILNQIELVALADRRVLIILVTRDGLVHNRVVDLGEPVSQDELNSARNYVNRSFEGWSVWEARRELLRRIEQERAAYDTVLRRLTMLYGKGLLEVEQAREVHTEGASNLIGLDLHLTREKMRDLLRALEEKQRVIELLDRFLEQCPGEVQVRVGLEEAHPAMQELALIGIAFTLPGGLAGKIAVLGPMRMRYDRVMSAVLHVGRAIESAQA